jgi:hypothetical protein
MSAVVPSPPCTDLRAFAPPYRVRAAQVNPQGDRPARRHDDPWELVLSGARGFVAPAGGGHLLACTHHRNTTAAILAKVPGAVVTQDGDDGQNVRFHARHLDAVAGVLRLRRRRQVSEAERQRLAALSAAHSPFRQSISESALNVLRSPDDGAG